MATGKGSLREFDGDLFTGARAAGASGPPFSLAHCVSADLNMGKGIAKAFKVCLSCTLWQSLSRTNFIYKDTERSDAGLRGGMRSHTGG